MMNNQIRNRFTELKVTGQRCTMTPEETREKDLLLIHYLESVIDNNEVAEFEDVGFCYWNNSDNYALIKDGSALMRNHQVFYEHIRTGAPHYLYWLVCDATQRLTLEKDGYSDYWWDLYRKAIEENDNSSILFAQFNAHRAALYINPIFPHTQCNLAYAMSSFETFLQKAKTTPEYPFYKVMYLSLISRFSAFDKLELRRLCEDLFAGLSEPKITNNYLIGEWKSFVIPFDIHEQSIIGINSVINALIYSNELNIAQEIYNNACDMGLPRNFYIETRLQ